MKFGVITPSANTVVQPEYDAMRPAGVTNHIFRMAVKNPPWSKDADFVEIVRQMNVGLDDAVDQAMTCDPDHLVLGVSIESIWDGGVAASERLNERVEQRAGGSIKLTQAAEALPAALKAYGIKRRLALLTPYYPVAEPHLRQYVDEIGYELVRIKNLSSARPTGIAQISAQVLRGALRELDGDDIEGIIQFGANLPMMRVAAEAEQWLGKPVIAINTATYWHALRQNGISDKIYGCGQLLSDH